MYSFNFKKPHSKTVGDAKYSIFHLTPTYNSMGGDPGMQLWSLITNELSLAPVRNGKCSRYPVMDTMYLYFAHFMRSETR
jgi:hypothetical protein